MSFLYSNIYSLPPRHKDTKSLSRRRRHFIITNRDGRVFFVLFKYLYHLLPALVCLYFFALRTFFISWCLGILVVQNKITHLLTTVHVPSPFRTLAILPGSRIEKTIIGILFSMASDVAVLSITRKFFVRTSI